MEQLNRRAAPVAAGRQRIAVAVNGEVECVARTIVRGRGRRPLREVRGFFVKAKEAASFD